MSAHSSKGLEFPVVFVADTGRAFSDKDAANRLVYSDEIGLAFRLRAPSGIVVCDNPVRDIINLYNYDKMYEEELRIFYVALTRARERLYMVGKSSLDDIDKFIERCKRKRENLDSYSARRLSSYLEIALCASEGGGFVDCEQFLGELPSSSAEELTEEEKEDDGEQKEDTVLCNLLTERFNYVYPDRMLAELPKKLSVSETTPTVLDGTEGERLPSQKSKERWGSDKPRLPAFMDSRNSEESKRRGIATHYLMQFADLDHLNEKGALAELKRLAEGGFISAADRDRVRVEEIELFRRSPLFSRMLGAKNLYRELRFTLKIPAEELTGEEERRAVYKGKEVLVQGVIDCVIEDENGEFCVADYKTDRLSGEELSSKERLAEGMRERHGLQLSYYARAVESIFGKYPSSVQVYSLQFGDSVDVSL
jgi:ATP-dependent helicase/nuclease subunit A